MDTSKLHNPQVAPAVFVGTHILVGREDLREIWGRLETLVQYGV